MRNYVTTETSVAKGQFVTLNPDMGYSPSQCREAMQVTELMPGMLTVRCDRGDMTKTYDHFSHVLPDMPDKRYVWCNWFEDGRYAQQPRVKRMNFGVYKQYGGLPTFGLQLGMSHNGAIVTYLGPAPKPHDSYVLWDGREVQVQDDALVLQVNVEVSANTTTPIFKEKRPR